MRAARLAGCLLRHRPHFTAGRVFQFLKFADGLFDDALDGSVNASAGRDAIRPPVSRLARPGALSAPGGR